MDYKETSSGDLKTANFVVFCGNVLICFNIKMYTDCAKFISWSKKIQSFFSHNADYVGKRKGKCMWVYRVIKTVFKVAVNVPVVKNSVLTDRHSGIGSFVIFSYLQFQKSLHQYTNLENFCIFYMQMTRLFRSHRLLVFATLSLFSSHVFLHLYLHSVFCVYIWYTKNPAIVQHSQPIHCYPPVTRCGRSEN